MLITNLGLAYLEVGEDITAREYFDLAIRLYPEFFPAAAFRLATFRTSDAEGVLQQLNAMEAELAESGEKLDFWVFPEARQAMKNREVAPTSK